MRFVGATVIWLAATSFGLAQPSFVNWETAPVHPVDMTPDGTKLLVTNTADNRLEIFTIAPSPPVTAPVWAASVTVGLDPVSVRARTNTEAWVINRISDTISVVDLSTLNVVATLATGDEPSDVVFAGSPQKAWITVSGLDQVKVYDPLNRAAAPTTINIAGHRPTAMATDGTRVFATIFFSGNRSTIVAADVVSQPDGPAGGVNPPSNTGTPAFNPPIAAGLPPPPPVSLIVNRETTPNGEKWKDDAGRFWDAKVTWMLNQNACAVINATSQAVTYAKNIGNLQMGIAVQPTTGKVTITQIYLRNEARFEEVVDNQFARVRIAVFDPASAVVNGISDLNQHLMVSPPQAAYKTNVTQAEHDMSLGDPRGIVWKDSSFAYVSGMDSNNVIRTNASGQRQATINVGQGPTGLVFDAVRRRVYCYNRFDANVSVINVDTDLELSRVGFYDPTPIVIKQGRPLQYDSHQFSKLGQGSCNSCHIDAKSDMQAWDVGDPAGVMVAFDSFCSNLPGAGPCNDWHPMKGPLMTQTLQGIIGNGPMHWRGDRADINHFKGGFTGFLGLAIPPSDAQMQKLESFLATIVFPPQPNRTINDALPANVSGYPGNPANGQALFNAPPIGGAIFKCTDCHNLPSGGGLTILPPNLLGQPQGLKTPQLRNLYQQTGFSKVSQATNRGYGYGHDGAFDSLFNFLQNHFANFAAGQAGIDQRNDLEAFLLCFPTGTHAAIGMQLTFDGSNNNSAGAINLFNTMLSLADSGAVALTAKGIVGGIPRGYAYLANTNNFQPDKHLQIVSATSLRTGAALGAEITFTVVPTGTETRIGIDRDEDGWYDRDELNNKTNPADPNSKPIDDDGDWVGNTYDVCPNTVVGTIVDSAGCPPNIFGDFDHDGDVDNADYAVFDSCSSGPLIAHGGALSCFQSDHDVDGDVDQEDFGYFQRCSSGAGTPANPQCAN